MTTSVPFSIPKLGTYSPNFNQNRSARIQFSNPSVLVNVRQKSKKEQKTNPKEVLIKKEQSKIQRSFSVPEPNLRDSSESDKSKLVSLEEENVIMNRSKYFSIFFEQIDNNLSPKENQRKQVPCTCKSHAFHFRFTSGSLQGHFRVTSGSLPGHFWVI